jgi:hypothetical protein
MTTEAAALADAPRLPETKPLVSWFTGQFETVPLKVGGTEFQIAREVPARVAFSTTQGLDSDMSGWQEYSLRKAAGYLRGWNLKADFPEDRDARMDVLRKMRRSRFEKLYELIVNYDSGLERRHHQLQWFTLAEWDEKAKADKALPKWETLTPYIEPQVSINADCWFEPEDETFTLALPDGHWMRVKAELTQGEFVSLIAPPAQKDGDPEPFVPNAWVGARRLALYLTAWSMVMPDGRPVPLTIESLAEMDASKFSVMHKTLEAFEQIVKKERESNPTGANS